MADPATQIITASSLAGKPVEQRKWLVADWMPARTTTALYGDGGLGKSLLAMQLMTCCAAGKRFLQKDTMHCPVLGVFCEDEADELHRRQIRINEHYQINFQDLNDVHWWPRLGHVNSLATFLNSDGKETGFFNELQDAARSLEVRLVVIDTAADTFNGDENKRGQVRYFISLLNRLAIAIDGCVLLLAHPSASGMDKGTGTGGSTAWHNTVRSRLFLSRPPEDDEHAGDTNIRQISQKKANFSAVDPNATLLVWDKGIFRPALDDNDAVENMRKNAIRNEIQEFVEHEAEKGRGLNTFSNTHNYAPKFIARRSKLKAGKMVVEKQIDYMLDNGILVIQDRRIDGKNKQILRVATKLKEEA